MDVHRRGLGLRGVSAKDEPQRRAPRRCDIIMPEADPMYKVSDGRGAFKQRATSPTGGSLALVRKPFGRTTCPLLEHPACAPIFGWVRVPDTTTFGRWQRQTGERRGEGRESRPQEPTGSASGCRGFLQLSIRSSRREKPF